MAKMYVTEYQGLGSADNGEDVQAVAAPPLVEQPTVAIGATSASSLSFNPLTTIVRIHVDVIASVNITAPGGTATLNSGRMVAGQTEYFRVPSTPQNAAGLPLGYVANVIANT